MKSIICYNPDIMGNTVGSQKNLTKLQQQILIGGLLGDTCLEQNGRNTRLRIEHGLRQEQYLRWKYEKFASIATSVPRLTGSKSRGKLYQRWHISSFSIPQLNEYREKFYRDKRKIVPKDIGSLLVSPISLAVWFMDDGYKRNDCNALRISTDCFSVKENSLLQKCLKDNFGIASALHKKGKVWNIYIPKDNALKFCKIIRSYVIPDLEYKIALTP